MKRWIWLLLLVALCVGCRDGSDEADDDANPPDGTPDDDSPGDDDDNDDTSPGSIVDQLAADEARIYRDYYGVPHVYGGSNAALFYAAGYAHAQDHLTWMLETYRTIAGRRAEIDGPDWVPSDYYYRLLRVRARVEEDYDEIAIEAQEAAESFAAGIDFYVSENPDEAPTWFEPVTGYDVIAQLKSVILDRAIEQLTDDLENGGASAALLPPLAPQRMASNFWALAPDKTDDGHVMLQGDPHTLWEGRTPWYEIHLASPDLNVAGAAIWGMPLMLLGHNERIAWTITNNSPDVADAYVLTLTVDEPPQYEYDGYSREFMIVADNIPIAGQSPQPVNYFYSHHGPVFAWGAGIALAAKLATWEEVRVFDQLLAMAQATDLASFKTALQIRQFARWNVGYGDRDGIIYYVWNGRVYQRPDGYDFTRPVPGNTSETEWGPLVPFSELPQETNPVDDFLQNCNNAPWFVSPNTSIQEGDFPDYVIGPQTINGRGVRALDRLSGQAIWTTEQLQALSFDDFSEYAAAWLPVLDYCCDEQQGAVPDPQGYLADAIALLRAWDYRTTVDATAVHLAQEWIYAAAGVWGVIDPRDPPDPQTWTAEQQQAAVQLLLAVATASVEDYGAVAAPWGDIHYMVRGEQTYPLPGSGPVLDSLFQADGRYNEAREIVCETGSSFQMLVELAEPVRAWTVRPISQSNDPTSSHYADITALFAQQQYKPAWFTDADVLANPDPEAPEPLTLWVP